MRAENWKKVKEILEEVLPLETIERRKFLDKSGIASEIRAEVESLISFEEEAGNMMQLSALEFSKDFLTKTSRTL